MILLVEGVDKSGKTSLIQELLKKFPGAIVIKNEHKPTDYSPEFIAGVYAGLYSGLRRLHKTQDPFIILDRSHITEIVYGHVLRNYNAYEVYDWKKVEEKIKKYTLLVYMYAPQEVLERRYVEEKEEFILEKHIPELLANYEVYLEHFTKLYKSKILRLNSTREMSENLLKVFNLITNR